MHAVADDEQGNVCVTGVSTFNMDKDNLPTLLGQVVAPAGGFVLVVNPDFSRRLLWTTFEADAYASAPRAVAAANGAIAIASNVTKDAMLTQLSQLGGETAFFQNIFPYSFSISHKKLSNPAW